MACPASVDQSFGPWAGPVCRGGFDFTLLFEESILALPLLCVFLLAASICLIGLSTAMLILWARTSSATIVHTRATIATASLAFVASLGVGLLSWLEHDRALRPSFVLFVYLFLSVILDLTRTRTLWLLNADPAIAAVFTTTVVLRAVMLVMDSIEKRNILAKPYRETSAESTRGPLNLTLFVWLVPLFVKGYKNILVLDDLEQFDTKLRSGPLSKALLAAWEKGMPSSLSLLVYRTLTFFPTVPNKKRTGIFCLTCFRVLIRPALAAAIPRLFLIGFTYAQPFMVTAAVELADQPDIMPYNNRGYGLIAAYGLVYAGVAISIGQYSWRARRFASMMRASIGGLIYHESLRLDIMSPSVVPTAALTLMSTDIEIIIIGLYQVHELWASATEISIAMYLIYRQLGAACAMPISVAIGRAHHLIMNPADDNLCSDLSLGVSCLDYHRLHCCSYWQSSRILDSGISRACQCHIRHFGKHQRSQDIRLGRICL
nr:abc transporter c family member 9 [Quercus suber]